MSQLNFKSNTYEIIKAYSFLENSTPLKLDCGKLCMGKCCKGTKNDGMWLFPSEADLFKNDEQFSITETDENFGYPMLVCNGVCDRHKRPLACRIFPLFPYVFKDNSGELKINVLPDIRARDICPVADNNMIERSFERSVRLSAQALLRNREIADYLINLTELLTYSPF